MMLLMGMKFSRGNRTAEKQLMTSAMGRVIGYFINRRNGL